MDGVQVGKVRAVCGPLYSDRFNSIMPSSVLTTLEAQYLHSTPLISTTRLHEKSICIHEQNECYTWVHTEPGKFITNANECMTSDKQARLVD